MYKHGLTVMRCQPFHIGHERIIDTMLDQCDMVTIVLGSTNIKDERNPWAFHDRKKMIKNVYGKTEYWKRIKILGAPDINDDMRWANFILKDIVEEHYVDELERKEYLGVDAYFAGSRFDARWFEEAGVSVTLLDRTDHEFPYCSGTVVRDMGIMQDSRWKLYINKVNHDLIETYFGWKKWDRM